MDQAFRDEMSRGYALDEPHLVIGSPLLDGELLNDARVRLALSMANRHGLIAGATGTGKTKTLQLLAGQLSAAGVPVFVADIKGDVTGIAAPGDASNPKVQERAASLGWTFEPAGHPVELLSLSGALGARLTAPAAIGSVVESGRYGRKAKKGFYKYDAEGKKGEPDPEVYALFRSAPVSGVTQAGDQTAPEGISAAEIQQRCVLALLNEAARCLQEGVIRSARDGDIGAVYGFGFPPFRGGPFRYMDSIGAAVIVQQLEELNGRFPGRFEPADNLLEMARRSARFHADQKS